MVLNLVIYPLRPEGGSRGQKIRLFCLWLTLVQADRLEPKLAAKEIAFTQKLRLTFSFEIYSKTKYKSLRFIESDSCSS